VTHGRAPSPCLPEGQTELALPLEAAPLDCSLRELGALEIRQVRRTAQEGLLDRLLQNYHYLGYTRPVGNI